MSATPAELVDALGMAMVDHVDQRGLGGAVWSVSDTRGRAVGSAGWLDPTRRRRPMPDDALFRVASLTKPIVAVAALRLVADGRLALDDPIDDVVPELADRQVLVDPEGLIDGPTEPAERPISLRDLLTFRCGWGMDFRFDRPQPVLERMNELGVGVGGTAPQLAPEEYLARLASLPLADQPGTRWRYHTGSDILGVILERVHGTDLGEVLATEVLAAIGANDAAFWVEESRRDRFSVCRLAADDGSYRDWDDPATGMWSGPPAFRSGATGLVAGIDDIDRFGRLLLDRGSAPEGVVVLAEGFVAEMTRNQLTEEQVRQAAIEPDGSLGWGLGLGVRRHDGPTGRTTFGDHGWDGGLGASWRNDVATGRCAVLLTTDGFDNSGRHLAMEDFWAELTRLTAT